MIRICHLSDLHLYSRNGQLAKAEKALSFAEDIGFDHMVMTGDMVHYPTRRDFKIARRLLGDFGLLDGRRLSLTIGNHEIYGGIQFVREIMSFPGKSARIDYNKKILEFVDYFPEAFEGVNSISQEAPFPYIKNLGDLLILGINSTTAYSILHNPFASGGRVSDEQLEALEVLLSKPGYNEKRKIALIHHHFCGLRELRPYFDWFKMRRLELETLRLYGKKRLLSFFARNDIGAVLHGHVHKSAKYQNDGMVFSNAGGSIDGWDPYQLSVNMIAISDSMIGVDIHTLSLKGEPTTQQIFGEDLIPGYAN